MDYILVSDDVEERQDFRNNKKYYRFNKIDHAIDNILDGRYEILTKDNWTDETAAQLYSCAIFLERNHADIIETCNNNGIPFVLVSGNYNHCEYLEFNGNGNNLKLTCRKKINGTCNRTGPDRRKKDANRELNFRCNKNCEKIMDDNIKRELNLMINKLKIHFKGFNKFPVFSMSFFLDFITWYRYFGETLIENQLEHKIELNNKLTKMIAFKIAKEKI